MVRALLIILIVCGKAVDNGINSAKNSKMFAIFFESNIDLRTCYSFFKAFFSAPI